MVDNLGVNLWGGSGIVVSNNPLDGHYQRGCLVLLLSMAGCGPGDDRFMVVLLLPVPQMRGENGIDRLDG